MKRIVLSLFVAIALSGCGTPASESGRKPAADPHALVAAGATLLDVRTASEYASGHLDGATLIPVDEVGSRLDEIPRDRAVVVYCRSGGRSARAAAVLEDAGYDVYDLGSIDNW